MYKLHHHKNVCAFWIRTLVLQHDTWGHTISTEPTAICPSWKQPPRKRLEGCVCGWVGNMPTGLQRKTSGFDSWQGTKNKTRMWANAQRDGRPVEYRWRPLFNTAQFGWRPLLECRTVTLPRRETRWNLLGCPKLANRYQSLAGQSSPYYEDMWRRYCCLTSFSDCRCMP